MKDHQKSVMLKFGYVAVLLGLSGLFSYLIVQVPSLRAIYGEYGLDSEFLNSVAY